MSLPHQCHSHQHHFRFMQKHNSDFAEGLFWTGTVGWVCLCSRQPGQKSCKLKMTDRLIKKIDIKEQDGFLPGSHQRRFNEFLGKVPCKQFWASFVRWYVYLAYLQQHPCLFYLLFSHCNNRQGSFFIVIISREFFLSSL